MKTFYLWLCGSFAFLILLVGLWEIFPDIGEAVRVLYRLRRKKERRAMRRQLGY